MTNLPRRKDVVLVEDSAAHPLAWLRNYLGFRPIAIAL